MSNLWFTSDHHFNHANIIKYCDRPFIDVEHMNEEMIEKWNYKIHPRDTVHYIGDLGFFRDKDKGMLPETVFSRLNGLKHLILGNHDERPTKQLAWVSIEKLYRIKVQGQQIVMCHYPIGKSVV